MQLGFVGGLSGRVADLGIAGRNGATLAVEERNAAGGLLGRTVELIVEDDGQDVERARLAVNSLIAKRVEGIIGPMTSVVSEATVPIVNAAKMVMMSPTTTTDHLSGKDDYFFRVSGTTRQYATKMAEYARQHRGITTVSVIYDLNNRAYTESWVSVFRDHFVPQGGSILAEETFLSGPDVSLLEIARRAIAVEPEGLVIAASALDAALICQQFRKLGNDQPVFVAEWAATEQLIALGGQAVEGVTVSQFFDRFSTTPRYLRFHDSYRTRFGQEPGFASVNAYDAVNVVLDALEQRREGESLKEAIVRVRVFPGVQGAVNIDAYGDADRDSFLSLIRDGKFVAVE